MDQATGQEKSKLANQMASLQSGSPDSYQKRAMEQNLAAEKFIQDLEISEQRKSKGHQASMGSVQDAVMEEQTISRYLVRGGSPSLGGDTMQRSKFNPGVADTTDGRKGFQNRKSGGVSPDSYPGFALQNIQSAQMQGSADFNASSGQKQAPNEVHSFDNRQLDTFQNMPGGAMAGSFAKGQREFEMEIQNQNQIKSEQNNLARTRAQYNQTDSNLVSPPQIDASASRPLRSKSPDVGNQKSQQNQPGDSSQDMSMALNERIQKLKNDLRGTTSTNADVAQRDANQFSYQVNIQRSPESFANTLASRDLRCKIMRQTDQTEQVLLKSRSRSPVLSPSDPKYELEAERARLENQYLAQVQHSRSRSREDSRSSPLVRQPPLRVKHRAQFPSGASPQSNMLIRDSTNSKPSAFGQVRNMSAERTPITDTNFKMGSARGRSNSALQRNSRLASRRTNSGSGLRTATGSQLRKKPSLSSIQNELQAISIKQVKFQNESQSAQNFMADGESSHQQNISPNIPQDALPLMKPPLQSAQDSLNLDKFYQDLIKKERLEFEKVLKSKLCIERAETTKKMRKQIQKASEKLEKVSELEKHLKYAKNNNERLRIEWDAMKNQLTQTEKTLSIQVQENQLLRNKLDALWDKYEEEKDIVMMVTKAEVEKTKHQELEALQLRLNAAHEHNEHLTSRVSHMATIQEENQESIAERSKLFAEKEVLESKVNRLELENKRLKDELEKSQEAQMAELRQKYELMKTKYAQMASSSSQLRQLMVEGRDSSIRPHTNSALDGSLNGPYQSQPLLGNGQNLVQTDAPDILKGTEGLNTLSQLGRHSNINETRSNRSKSKTRARKSSVASKDIGNASQKQQVRVQMGKPNDSAEVWRLRCKILAEKYFNIIRDLKLQLQTVKEDAQRNLQETRKELGNQLMLELKKYILKLDKRVTEGRDMKKEAKEFMATQNLQLNELDTLNERETTKHQRMGATQGLGPDLITPAFQSNQNLGKFNEKVGHSATQNFSSDALGMGGLTEDLNGRFGISPQADPLNLYSAASSSYAHRGIDERPASFSPTRVTHVVHQTDVSGYQSVPQQHALYPHEPRMMLSQYGRSLSRSRVMPPNNPVETSVIGADRSTDSQPFYVKNTILRNESLLANGHKLNYQASTNSQISPDYSHPRPLHLMCQPSISKASRLSSNSRDRPVEQIGYINGQPHRMAALRSKSPTATNHSYTSQKVIGSFIERSDRDIPNDYIRVSQERELSKSKQNDSLSARNHAAHQEIMQALHQQQTEVNTQQVDRFRNISRASRNETQNQPVSFQQNAFQQPVLQNQAIRNSQENLIRDERSQERAQMSEKKTMLQAGIQSSQNQGLSGARYKTFHTQQTSNKSIKQSIRENIRSQRRLDFNRASSIKSRQSSNGSRNNDMQVVSSNPQLEGGIVSKSRESIETSKKTQSRKSRFEQYSAKDSYDRYSQRSKSKRSTISNNLNQGDESRSRDSQRLNTQKVSDKVGLPYENISSSAAQDTKQIQLNRIISPTNVKKTMIAEYENYNQDIQDVANSAASFRQITGNENSQFMVSIDTDKVFQGSNQFAQTGNHPAMAQTAGDPSGGTSNLKTTWNRTGQFSGQLQGTDYLPIKAAIVSIEQDPGVQDALDQNLNTFEDLDAQIQKSIASLKKMGGQSSKNSSLERNESAQTNKYKQKKKSGAKGSGAAQKSKQGSSSLHGSSIGQPPFK